MIDIKKLEKRLQELKKNIYSKETNSYDKFFWKLEKDKIYQMRLLPYINNLDNTFAELYIYYDLTDKSLVSPISYGGEDPIVEFIKILKKKKIKDSYKIIKFLEPRLRVFVPALMRGESQVKYLQINKTTYAEILSYIVDPDIGDITDLEQGTDIIYEVISPKSASNTFGKTNIRLKLKRDRAADDLKALKMALKQLPPIHELLPPASYDELKEILKEVLTKNEIIKNNEINNLIKDAININDKQSNSEIKNIENKNIIEKNANLTNKDENSVIYKKEVKDVKELQNKNIKNKSFKIKNNDELDSDYEIIKSYREIDYEDNYDEDDNDIYDLDLDDE